MKHDVLIIGAGLTGLVCARALKERGIDFLLLEATDRVGGRIKTDQDQGFLLDHGFQIFLTAYPEAQRWLDYDALKLCPFYPGALIQRHHGPVLLGDPIRKPGDALLTALAKIGSLEDKALILKLRQDVQSHSLEQLWERPEQSTQQLLRTNGFSEAFIQSFFQPFLAGVFLDPSLQSSSKLFYFVMKMFSSGQAAVPAQGMHQIPRQLAQHLPQEHIRLNSPVVQVEAHKILLKNGEQLRARAVVVATDPGTAQKLLKLPPRPFNASQTFYFASPHSPLQRPILLLNGRGVGPINNLALMSLVSADYAPENQHLIAITVLPPYTQQSPQRLCQLILKQASDWFGPVEWQYLKHFDLPFGLPMQQPPSLGLISRTRRLEPGLYVGGDHTETASINGAMTAGHRLANMLERDLNA